MVASLQGLPRLSPSGKVDRKATGLGGVTSEPGLTLSRLPALCVSLRCPSEHADTIRRVTGQEVITLFGVLLGFAGVAASYFTARAAVPSARASVSSLQRSNVSLSCARHP